MDGALVDLLRQIGADGLRKPALGRFLVASNALVVLAYIDDAPIRDEVHLQRLLFRGGDAVGLRRVQREQPPIVELDVLYQRNLCVQARFGLRFDEFTGSIRTRLD